MGSIKKKKRRTLSGEKGVGEYLGENIINWKT